jgi:hypothetical protein
LTWHADKRRISGYRRKEKNKILCKTLTFLKGLHRNPSRPPFFKGRRAFWGIRGGIFHFFLFEKGEEGRFYGLSKD